MAHIINKASKQGTLQVFYDITGNSIEDRSYLRMMDILKDVSGTIDTRYLMNIFKYYDGASEYHDSFYDEYEVGYNEWWDNISYLFYGTPYLWWLVALANDVVNPYEELVEGTNIKVLSVSKVYEIISELDNIRKL